jgi:hypothetical protein
MCSGRNPCRPGTSRERMARNSGSFKVVSNSWTRVSEVKMAAFCVEDC